MRLKLDENLGRRGADLLRAAGHDVATVPEEHLETTPDASLIEVCRTENRVLVTLDSDFANPLLFIPNRYPGIAALRLPPRTTASHLLAAIETLRDALGVADITGKLWIVQPGRVREYQQDDEES